MMVVRQGARLAHLEQADVHIDAADLKMAEAKHRLQLIGELRAA
jgi:hypothetical protein